ncbi:DEAD box RNA helicase [Spraguea lophii 42_110]|uniref:RNA helicase n=1 Tax=Spraguea lophii (strain 42_110) TaxID=1358809 RepID=S7WCQ8_SPRLO|nr:DEAD box RNA helicase [Spraguea lophii 42_110]
MLNPLEEYFIKISKEVRKEEIIEENLDNKDYKQNHIILEPLNYNSCNIEEIIKIRQQNNINFEYHKNISPIKNFIDAILPLKVIETLNKEKIITPTPIQSQIIPIILSRINVLGIAETGSGKTLAYIIPMIKIVKNNAEGLVLVPTRELCIQITQNFKKYSSERIASFYGSTRIKDNINSLKNAHIIISTPGRMLDLLRFRPNCLENVKICIIDEMDQMLDNGFKPQLQRILCKMNRSVQLALFSATSSERINFLNIECKVTIGKKDRVSKNIKQVVEIIEEKEKKNKLLEKVNEKDKFLIFVNKQEKADEIALFLSEKYLALSLHSGKDQEDRENIIKDYRDGIINILVATSIASRGLDLDINIVINYDCPISIDEYIHRVGRTGRAGKYGESITYLTSSDTKIAHELYGIVNEEEKIKLKPMIKKLIKNLENGKELNKKVKKKGIEFFDIKQKMRKRNEVSVYSEEKSTELTDIELQKKLAEEVADEIEKKFKKK